MGQGQFLYIPLCFLLINPPRIHLKSGLVSLHSTMFSINLNGCRSYSGKGTPLHSTMFSINRMAEGSAAWKM